jgi:DNA-binding GntR family transcriptional regulator
MKAKFGNKAAGPAHASNPAGKRKRPHRGVASGRKQAANHLECNDGGHPIDEQASARDTVHAGVYAAMKLALMRGQYKPGQKITIRGVASALGTSATPVRESIRRLAAEGALEHLRAGRARLPELDLERLEEITEVRVALETLAARRAALCISADNIRELQAIQIELAATRDRGDYAAYLGWNEAFHFAYYRASAMPNLVRAIESMWLQAGPYLALLLPSMRGIDLHDLAIEAARRHDGNAAAAAIEEDIRRAATRLSTLLVQPAWDAG